METDWKSSGIIHTVDYLIIADVIHPEEKFNI